MFLILVFDQVKKIFQWCDYHPIFFLSFFKQFESFGKKISLLDGQLSLKKPPAVEERSVEPLEKSPSIASLTFLKKKKQKRKI